MFGRFNSEGRGRQARGWCRRKGYGFGRRHGLGRNGGRGFRSNRADGRPVGMLPEYPEERRADVVGMREARPMVAPEENAAVEVCPLCDNHCPLSAPSCKQGRAYAASMMDK